MGESKKWQEHGKAYFDGYERGILLICRHGWTEARNMFNEQYPKDWKPTSPDAWQHSKGFMAALTETM